MLTDSLKKVRHLVAFVLLGATALYLLAVLFLMFKSSVYGSDISFGIRSALVQGEFVSPVWVLVLVLAVALATAYGGPSTHARIVVLVALGLLAFMALLGLITWLAGLGADTGYGGAAGFGGEPLAGKATGSLFMLAKLALVAAGAFYAYTALRALPPAERKPAGAPTGQWSGPPATWDQGQGQPSAPWGAPPGQPQAQRPGQTWGAPSAPGPEGGATTWGAPPAPGGQPGGGTQQSWQPPPAGQQPSWGTPGSTPAPPPQQQPLHPPAPPAASPAPEPPSEPPSGGASARSEQDDPPPGWWAPGS